MSLVPPLIRLWYLAKLLPGTSRDISRALRNPKPHDPVPQWAVEYWVPIPTPLPQSLGPSPHPSLIPRPLPTPLLGT